MPQHLYRKKPVVVEAMTVRAILDALASKKRGPKQVPAWVKEALDAPRGTKRCSMFMWDTSDRFAAGAKIYTLEGVMDAAEGDYIIRGVKGELYPCKPDIFAETYEEVTE